MKSQDYYSLFTVFHIYLGKSILHRFPLAPVLLCLCISLNANGQNALTSSFPQCNTRIGVCHKELHDGSQIIGLGSNSTGNLACGSFIHMDDKKEILQEISLPTENEGDYFNLFNIYQNEDFITLAGSIFDINGAKGVGYFHVTPEMTIIGRRLYYFNHLNVNRILISNHYMSEDSTMYLCGIDGDTYEALLIKANQQETILNKFPEDTPGNIIAYNEQLLVATRNPIVLNHNLELVEKYEQLTTNHTTVRTQYQIASLDSILYLAGTSYGFELERTFVIDAYRAENFEFIKRVQIKGANHGEVRDYAPFFSNLKKDLNSNFIVGVNSNFELDLSYLSDNETSIIFAKVNPELEIICQEEYFFNDYTILFGVDTDDDSDKFWGYGLQNAQGTDFFYPILIEGESGCQVSSITPLVIDAIDFSLYPNPTTESISIRSNESFRSYKIINVEGQVSLLGDFVKDIDVRTIPEGMYYLQLIDQDGLLYTRSFMKFQ